MASSDSPEPSEDTEPEQDVDAKNASEFLGTGPAKALEKNSSADEAFSPE